MAVRRALAFSFLSTNAAGLISFVSAMIIARVLTPTEIGVYSVAAALISIVHQIRSFGVAAYLVQETDLTHDRIRAAFGLLLITSWTLALVVFGASFPAGAFYGDPGVASVLHVLALNFVLAPFGGIAMTMLARDMRFGARAVFELFSALALAVTSVALALLGFSYMSLAWGSLAGIITGAVVANLYRPRGLPWLPSFREMRRVIAYGGPSTVADLVRTMRFSAAELIVGRTLGLAAVAFLSRGNSLTGQFHALIGQSVQKVAFPYFAQERREGREIKSSYATAAAYITGIGWPFFAVLALLAEPAIRLLFGHQWDASIPLTRIACLAAAIVLPWWGVANVANAMGQPRVTMRVELQVLLATCALVAVASAAGLEAVAWALCGASALHAFLAARALRQLIGIRLRDYSGDLLKSAGVALLSVLAALPGALLVPHALGAPGQVAAGIAAAGVAWVIAIVWLRHPLMRELPRAAGAVRSWWFRS